MFPVESLITVDFCYDAAVQRRRRRHHHRCCHTVNNVVWCTHIVRHREWMFNLMRCRKGRILHQFTAGSWNICKCHFILHIHTHLHRQNAPYTIRCTFYGRSSTRRMSQTTLHQIQCRIARREENGNETGISKTHRRTHIQHLNADHKCFRNKYNFGIH